MHRKSREIRETDRKGWEVSYAMEQSSYPFHTSTKHRIQQLLLLLWLLLLLFYSPFLGLGRFFCFLILYKVGRTPWTEISPAQGRYLHTEQHRTNVHNSDIHVFSGIRTHYPSVRADEDSSCLRSRGHCDRSRNNKKKKKLNENYNFQGHDVREEHINCLLSVSYWLLTLLTLPPWRWRQYIVAYRPVARRRLCKQGPLLRNARKIEARNNKTVLCNPFPGNGSVNTPTTIEFLMD
jgi:hypothetical protein